MNSESPDSDPPVEDRPIPVPGSVREKSGSTDKSGVFVPVVIAMVIAAIAIRIGYVWITNPDGFDLRTIAFLGVRDVPFHEVNGEIFFNDEKIRHGHLEAVPVRDDYRLSRAIAPVREDGTFSFVCDIGGTLHTGLPEGDYRVLLHVNYPATGFGYPDPMLPAKYYDPNQTPVKLAVTKESSGQAFVIRESGEIQEQPGGRGGGPRSAPQPQQPSE